MENAKKKIPRSLQQDTSDILIIQLSFTHLCKIQVETMKATIVQFFGENPSTSADIGRIVNEFHFQRLKGLLDDPRTAERIVYGGQCDKKSL
jgi:aldehyde dehydrogenase (NAD+)